jgi:hypothetical protein
VRLPTFSRQSEPDNSDAERPTATGAATPVRPTPDGEPTTTDLRSAPTAADRAEAPAAPRPADLGDLPPAPPPPRHTADDRTADGTPGGRVVAEPGSTYRTAAHRTAADRTAADRAAADRTAADRTAPDQVAAEPAGTYRTAADRTTADRTADDRRAAAADADRASAEAERAEAHRAPAVAGPKPRASLLATLGLILGVASALLVLSGPLLGYGIGVAVLALILSLGGIRATGKRHVAGKTDALIGMVLALGAIVVGVLALTGSLSWLGTDMQPVNSVREWLDAQFVNRF